MVRNLTIQRDALDANKNRHIIKAYFMYWFVGENVTTSSHITRVLLSSWDRIVHNRAHRWAYVLALSPITEGQRTDGLNSEQTKKMLTDFIRQIVPTFQIAEMPKPTPGH